MSGTVSGAKKATVTSKKRHGKDFYIRIGAMGGRASRGGGFAANKELARTAGAKGGRISKRGKAKKYKLVDSKLNGGYLVECASNDPEALS